jgi:glycosyltransferase involved in cell wall biosynthesis
MTSKVSSPSISKIVFVNHTGVFSGAERVLLTMLDGLDPTRYQSVGFCPANSELANQIRARGIPVVGLEALQARFTWSPLRLVRYLRSYFRVIREFRNAPQLRDADLIHANTLRAGLVASFATVGSGIPVIWHLQDIMRIHPISTAIRWTAVLMPGVHVVAASRATAIRFQGWLLRILSGSVPVIVLHNSVDSRQFHPDQAARFRVRQELQLGDHIFAFAIIGQLTRRKGQLETIRAFRNLASRFPMARLLIVGAPLFNDDHKYFDLLKSTATDLGISDKVLFLGQRSDVNSLLNAADAVVVNSHREPFGLVALEAMAAGKPVVAARVDGIPELVVNEVTGLLVPPGNDAALTSAMAKVCSDPALCQQLSGQARTLVETIFTSERFLNQLEEIYSSILGDSTAVLPNVVESADLFETPRKEQFSDT